MVIKFICVVFSAFLFSCSGNEEQTKRDLDFVLLQQEKFLEIENTRTKEILEKMTEFYFNGIVSQDLIKKYNAINLRVESGFRSYERLRLDRKILTADLIDSLHIKVIAELKKEIDEPDKKKKILLPWDEEDLLKLLDSCLNAKTNLSPQLSLSSKKTELIVLKNKINEAFSGAYAKHNTHCFWSPFSRGLIIKNYQNNGSSFLEVKFPDDINRNFFRRLRGDENDSDDTLSLSEIKISYLHKENKQIDSSFFNVDLSRLKTGKYKIDACLYLVTPDNTVKPTQHCAIIHFEVFK